VGHFVFAYAYCLNAEETEENKRYFECNFKIWIYRSSLEFSVGYILFGL
jgi:hypothetical protein